LELVKAIGSWGKVKGNVVLLVPGKIRKKFTDPEEDSERQ